MKKKFLIMILIVVVIAVGIGIYLCNRRQTTFDIGITVPAGSREAFVYSDEIICPTGDTITISAGENLGDTEVVLLPVKVTEENAYEATYLTPGMPVKIDVEKGAWFKVGISMQNTGTEEAEKFVTVKGVTVLIE